MMNTAKNLFLNAKIIMKSTREEKATLLSNDKEEKDKKENNLLKCISFKSQDIPYQKLN